LDGLQRGPIKIGEFKQENDWIELVVSTIQKRISTYSENDLFSIQALIRDRRELYQEKIVELKKDSVKNKSEINELNLKIKDEELKVESWKEENQRRGHNYIPFFVNLLQILAQKNELTKNEKKNIESQRSIWNDSSLLSDILKENFSKSGKLEFLEEAQNILKKEFLTNLGDWKKLSNEDKTEFPLGLKNIFDKFISKFLISLTKNLPFKSTKKLKKIILKKSRKNQKLKTVGQMNILK
jgi:hypothetical protein